MTSQIICPSDRKLHVDFSFFLENMQSLDNFIRKLRFNRKISNLAHAKKEIRSWVWAEISGDSLLLRKTFLISKYESRSGKIKTRPNHEFLFFFTRSKHNFEVISFWKWLVSEVTVFPNWQIVRFTHFLCDSFPKWLISEMAIFKEMNLKVTLLE